MFKNLKFLGFFLIFSNFLVSANALLLCKTFSWSYDTGGIISPASGWGNLYFWYTPVATIPNCATYQITMNQWTGDDNGGLYHQKTATYTAQLAAGTQIYGYGQVKQINGMDPWYVNTQLFVGGAQVAALSDTGSVATGGLSRVDRGFMQVIVTKI